MAFKPFKRMLPLKSLYAELALQADREWLIWQTCKVLQLGKSFFIVIPDSSQQLWTT